MLRVILAIFLGLIGIAPAAAALKTQTIAYSYGGKTFKGYLAYDDSFSGKRPGVLVVHEFWGLNDYARSRADQLAKLGFVAFAADMFGDGKAFEHPEEASAMADAVRSNLAEWVGRAQAALKVLQDHPNVDSSKLAAIGYCFGGATVLQLAYSGADLKAAVTFHGALPLPPTTKSIKGKILILHGGDDTHVTPEALQALKAKLDEGKVDYRVVVYPGAVHSFTVPGAEKRGMKGIAYNAEADRKSWDEMLKLFQGVFGTPKK